MVDVAKKIVIIGAGPCGLGAAYRLQELGYADFVVLEKTGYIGGLSTSFLDEQGFTWDIGGHVIHSHYEYFDIVFEKLMQGEYLTHTREAWIYLEDMWVPYPFQNNIRHLSSERLWECLKGLWEVSRKESEQEKQSFYDWIQSVFGRGIAEQFMLPYNRKVWAYDLKKMSSDWIKERVAVVDFMEILQHVILKKDDVAWGPNATFNFPAQGGTGGFFGRFLPLLGTNIKLNCSVSRVDTKNKVVVCENGTEESYDVLISTMPLDALIRNSDLAQEHAYAFDLVHSEGTIVGLGLKGQVNKDLKSKSWIYFPEDTYPFYRTTVFSHYSPQNVPSGHWSLMFEISSQPGVRIAADEAIESVRQAASKAGLISEADELVDRYYYQFDYSYPIPTLERDKILSKLQPVLEKAGIYARGRFGGWRYEIGNMDHCFMQGVEVVDRIVNNKSETTYMFAR